MESSTTVIPDEIQRQIDGGMYGWVIVRDHISDGGQPGTNNNAVGMIGPSGVVFTAEQIKRFGQPFKMLDDDEVLYYEGLYLGPDDELLFSPMDDFGMPNAGVTGIMYKDEGSDKFEYV